MDRGRAARDKKDPPSREDCSYLNSEMQIKKIRGFRLSVAVEMIYTRPSLYFMSRFYL